MRRPVTRRAALAGLCLGLGLLLGRPAVAAPAAPRATLAAFLRFESGGGRLTGRHWAAYMARYLAAPPGYDEPGWDTVTAIDGYRLRAFNCAGDGPGAGRCTAVVRYALAPTRGFATPNVVPHPRGGVETVTYTLVRTRRGWRLRPDFGAPRVRAAVLRARLAGA